MRNRWFERNPAQFARLKVEVEAMYPNLHMSIRSQAVVIAGSFPIDYDGSEADRYIIEVQLPDNYPLGIPIVREVGGRIPQTAERHIKQDGVACLFVDEEWLISNPNGSELLDFLRGPVRNFFIGQSLVEAGHRWPFGERSHGAKGILECYANLTQASNLQVAQKYLEMLNQKKVKGHWPCPCRSGKKLRDCHYHLVLRLKQRIPRSTLQRSWEHVQHSN
jgi:hypothetical protein